MPFRRTATWDVCLLCATTSAMVNSSRISLIIFWKTENICF